MWFLAGHQLVSLSPQQIVSCDQGRGDQGCDGGASGVCVRVRARPCARAGVRVCACLRACVCVRSCVGICVCLRAHACARADACVRAHVRARVGAVRVCLRTCVCVYKL
jgi:hypothetical protein